MVLGRFGWFWVVLGRFGWFWLVPCFSNYGIKVMLGLTLPRCNLTVFQFLITYYHHADWLGSLRSYDVCYNENVTLKWNFALDYRHFFVIIPCLSRCLK